MARSITRTRSSGRKGHSVTSRSAVKTLKHIDNVSLGETTSRRAVMKVNAETFHFVVASVHCRFKMDRAEQTKRIIRAVTNPYTTILGHVTGRQLLRRPGYDIDIEEVLAACATHGVAVEINANPWRLDLDWRWHETALRLGCLMSINPDAHSTRS